MIELERPAPDLEDLAAYLDGRLSGDRKARVEERLLRDEDYYEVFLATVRFAEEQAAGGTVLAGPWWRTRRGTASLVAAAAAVAAAIGLWRLGGGTPTGEWVARLDAAKVVATSEWDDPGWTRMRGPGSRFRLEELAFRLGARSVDLRVALAAADAAAAASQARDLESWATEADLLVVAHLYGDLAERLAKRTEHDDLEDLASEARSLEELVREAYADPPPDAPPEAERFALGAWAEAGRLAALAGDAEVLGGLLRDLRLARSVDAVAEEVAALETLAGRRDPGAEGFAAAGEAFEGITRALGG